MFEVVRNRLNSLPRVRKSLILVAFDALALVGVLWLSYQLRLGADFRPTTAQLTLMALAPAVALPIFLRFGLYRAVIRYLPERAIWTILQAMTLATLAWVFVLFLAEATRFGVLPRTIPIFYFLLGTIVIGGSRFAAKTLLWVPPLGKRASGASQVAIYGAGEAGRQLAAALRAHGAANVAAFIDDDKGLHGRDVMGVRVHAPERLEALIKDFGVQEVIVSIPSLEAPRRQTVLAELSKLPIKLRALPSISEIASGKYLVSQLREIDIDDLLGRSSVPADPELLQQMLDGRVILVSGAGGSIGSELCRIIAKWAPAKLVLLEANEFALYQIERALLKDAPAFPVIPVLGSVTDEKLVRRTIAAHGTQVVFHAAAHKHVPLVEANVLEGIRNNILGTLCIARAAFDGGVADFVLISSDKAVRPTNVMGATKRWSELIVRHFGSLAAAGSAQRFCAVRFGNVLGSNGSVVPLFREQIAAGGPVTLTDPQMTRYFMSIHEAAELIVQAGALSEGGDIFLLEMGEPVRIGELADNMIRLAGLSVREAGNPQGDIEVVVTGIRPGEKMFEELFYDASQAEKTRQPKILRAKMTRHSNRDIEGGLVALGASLEAEDEGAARKVVFEFIGD